MTRGYINHIWYKLLDEEGIPVSGASIYLYEYINSITQLNIYDENENSITQPIFTDSNGVFEFYIKDHIRANSEGGYGYTWDTQYIISWSKDDKGGIIKGDHLFGEFESVNTSGNSKRLNRAISNYIGWTIETHANFMFGTTMRCGSSSSSSSSSSVSSSSSSSVSSSSSSSSLSSSSSSVSSSSSSI